MKRQKSDATLLVDWNVAGCASVKLFGEFTFSWPVWCHSSMFSYISIYTGQKWAGAYMEECQLFMAPDPALEPSSSTIIHYKSIELLHRGGNDMLGL